MKVHEHDGGPARHVLAAMVTDGRVVKRLAHAWNGKRFRTPWENMVGGWAVDFYKKYGKPLGRDIGVVFDRWAAGGDQDEDTVKSVERFLVAISNDLKRNGKDRSPEYVTDLAGKHWNLVQAERFRDEVDTLIEAGKPEDVQALVNKYKPVEIGTGEAIDVLADRDFAKGCLEHRADVLVQPPGEKLAALRRFYGDRLERDGLVAFRATEKKGKTFQLLEVSWWGMLQRRRVAFFEIGDLSKHQIGRRLLTRALGRPLNAQNKDDPPVRYPTYFDPDAGRPDYEERRFDKPATLRQAYEALEKVVGRVGGDSSLFRLWVHPTNSISMDEIESLLHREADRGWVPDLIAIDYAELLAPPKGTKRFASSWEQIGENWASMRKVSQVFHGLVLTATQANAAGYDADSLDERHYSGSKQQNAHVTAMVGINQNEEQKRNQVYTLNMFNAREIDFDKEKHVHVAGCLAVANPCVVSSWSAGAGR
jgi:hypothetical protein